MRTLAKAAVADALGPVLGDNLAAELRRAIPQGPWRTWWKSLARWRIDTDED
jgi:hypothetical protein